MEIGQTKAEESTGTQKMKEYEDANGNGRQNSEQTNARMNE